MKMSTCQAPGKIILSGEYAVVFGYPGIAVPAPFTVTVAWTEKPCHTEPVEVRHGGTLSVTHSGIDNEPYLHSILDEIQKYTGPLRGHLAIENTIPIGRGMGSSTALVIAIVRCFYQQSPLPLKGEGEGEGCKEIALSIEDTVNHGHSGLDFAVIWKNAPIRFQKGKPYSLLPTPYPLKNAILIDTGKPKETTTEMVAWVKKNFLSPRERARVRGALRTIACCTERLLAGESPFTVFPDHYRAQVALGVVPAHVQDLIAEIEASGGAAKVIGAGGRSSVPSEVRSAKPRGGGGMVLALHQKPEKLHTIAQQHNMPTIALTKPHSPLLSHS